MMSIARVFKGCDTDQVSPVDGAKADPEKWYFEPESHYGPDLWSIAYVTREAAEESATLHGFGLPLQ